MIIPSNTTEKTFMKYFRPVLAALLAAPVFCFQVLAQEPVEDDAETQTPEAIIEQKLKALTNGAALGPINPSVVDGLYRVQVIGGPAVLITGDGEHVVMGDLYQVTDAGLVPVQDPYLMEARQEFVASLDPSETINFAPEGETRGVVYVFTDVDCGFCRRLHSHIDSYDEMGAQKPGYNDLGIEIRYLAYPRAGIDSPSASKLESAWCAKDPQKALDDLKNLRNIKPAKCDNPIAEQFRKGGELGVNATPALLFPDGRLMLGYMPPEKLLQAVEQGTE